MRLCKILKIGTMILAPILYPEFFDVIKRFGSFRTTQTSLIPPLFVGQLAFQNAWPGPCRVVLEALYSLHMPFLDVSIHMARALGRKWTVWPAYSPVLLVLPLVWLARDKADLFSTHLKVRKYSRETPRMKWNEPIWDLGDLPTGNQDLFHRACCCLDLSRLIAIWPAVGEKLPANECQFMLLDILCVPALRNVVSQAKRVLQF